MNQLETLSAQAPEDRELCVLTMRASIAINLVLIRFIPEREEAPIISQAEVVADPATKRPHDAAFAAKLDKSRERMAARTAEIMRWLQPRDSVADSGCITTALLEIGLDRHVWVHRADGFDQIEAVYRRAARACDRLARRSRAARNRPRRQQKDTRGRYDPASVRGTVVAVRTSCDKNAVSHNPVKGVKRPKAESGEGKAPALGDHQARDLLATPGDETIKHKRDRAILPTLLYHALRREELCKLKVKDFNQARRGVPHLKVSGKVDKTRYLLLHPGSNQLIHNYLEAAGHGADENGALFRPIRNNRSGRLDKAITPNGVYTLVRNYSAQLGFKIRPHALRATAATNALEPPGRHRQGPGMARPRQYPATRIYDHRKTRPEDSPTFKVNY